MNPYMAYDAVNTKIQSKKSRILDEEKLNKMLDLNMVDQVTDFLKSKYGLEKIINMEGNRELHRHELETLLKRYKVSEIENILHYFSGPYKDFLQVMLMKYEISDIIMLLRKIARGEELIGIENAYVHSEAYSKLMYIKLSASRDVEQFIDNLRDTNYYRVLKTIDQNDVISREFHMEMKLQSLLYRTLIKKAEKLEPYDREIAKDIVGLKIDLLNVQWIYRAKNYYNISPEEILIYCLQNGQRLGFARLRSLCYTKTADEMKELTNIFMKHKIFEGSGALEIEKNIDSYFYFYIKNKRFQDSIGAALSYIYRLNIIVKNMITVTEGIRYKLAKEDLKQYLVQSKDQR